MKTLFKCSLLSLSLVATNLFSLPCFSANEEAHRTKDPVSELSFIPDKAMNTRQFVPIGWNLETEVNGDLNKDGVEDVAIVIAKPDHAGCFADDIARAVVVAFGDKYGRLHRAALSHSLARLDFSLLSDVSLTIDRGSLVIENRWGTRELVVERLRFRFNSSIKKFQLIGQDRYQSNRLTMAGEEDTRNLITGDRIFELIECGDVISSAKSKLPRKPLKVFEEVKVGAVFRH